MANFPSRQAVPVAAKRPKRERQNLTCTSGQCHFVLEDAIKKDMMTCGAAEQVLV